LFGCGCCFGIVTKSSMELAKMLERKIADRESERERERERDRKMKEGFNLDFVSRLG